MAAVPGPGLEHAGAARRLVPADLASHPRVRARFAVAVLPLQLLSLQPADRRRAAADRQRPAGIPPGADAAGPGGPLVARVRDRLRALAAADAARRPAAARGAGADLDRRPGARDGVLLSPVRDELPVGHRDHARAVRAVPLRAGARAVAARAAVAGGGDVRP